MFRLLTVLAAVDIICAANFAVAQQAAASNPALATQIRWLKTADGVDFAVRGDPAANRRPIVLILALSADESLNPALNVECAEILRSDDYLCVSVDLPCHGNQRRPQEPEGLAGWRRRLEAGEALIGELNGRLRSVLDYLVPSQSGARTPVAVCGVSRGAFAATHFAISDRRVQWIVAYSPVTDLRVLAEFKGAESLAPVRQLCLIDFAGKLAERQIWIAIGDQDDRVGTDLAIQLARAISAAARQKNLASSVEIHVAPAVEHRTPSRAAQWSADWLKQAMNQ